MTATTLNRIKAITRRDFRQRLSYPVELASSLWTAAVGVFMFFFIGRLVGETPFLTGVDGGYFAYAAVGVTVITLSFTLLEVFRTTIHSEQTAGTLELLLAGPTPIRTFLLGSMVIPLALAGLQVFAYVLLGWIAAPEALHPLAWLRATPALALIVLTFIAIGLWSAAFVVFAQRGDPFGGLIIQATNLVAGAVFPVAVLPAWLQTVAHIVPTFYGFNALRGLMLEDASLSAVSEDLLILGIFDFALLVIGAFLLRRALAFARRMGTLGVQ